MVIEITIVILVIERRVLTGKEYDKLFYSDRNVLYL